MIRHDTFGSKSQHRRLAEQLDLAKKPPSLQPYPLKVVEPIWAEKTGVLIATGPSLSESQLSMIRDAHTADRCRVFTINNTYQVYPETDVHLSCDGPWWRWYWNDPVLRKMSEYVEMWTWYPDFAEEFGINYIKAIVEDGLSYDPGIVHINHGSGPMMMNLAMHYGINKLVLVGHDMKFAEDYKPAKCDPGSTPRHYFGEYPKPLQHWPSVKVRQGVLDGLIEAYTKINAQIVRDKLSIDVVNCTPDSALTMFRQSDLEKEI